MKFTCPECLALNEKLPGDPLGCACCGYFASRFSPFEPEPDDGPKPDDNGPSDPPSDPPPPPSKPLAELLEMFKKLVEPPPYVNPMAPVYPYVKPIWTGTSTSRSPCAYDGLPPGVYGLVCNCPLHSNYCR